MLRRTLVPALLTLAACNNASDPSSLFGEWDPNAVDTGDTGGPIDTGPDTDTDSDSTSWVQHCTAITSNTEWTADNGPHLVTCSLEVRSGTLTIEAGTVVSFLEGAEIVVGTADTSAGLEALGTSDAPVVFKPAAAPRPGHWLGLSFKSNAATATLTHTEVQFAGEASVRGAVDVTDASLTADHLTIEDSDGVGLWLRDAGQLAEASTDLTFRRTGGYPIRVGTSWADSLPESLTFEDVGNEAISLQARVADVTRSVTLRPRALPWAVETAIAVNGTVASPTELIVEAGNTLLFAPRTSLQVAQTAGASSLKLLGTESEPITLAALEPASALRWGGIMAGRTALDDGLVLQHLSISGAGGYFNQANNQLDAAIEIVDTPVLMQSVHITNTQGTGIVLEGTANFLPESGDISVSGADYPLEVPFAELHTLPTEADWTGNEHDEIRVQTSRELRAEVQWNNPGVPLHILGNALIDATASEAGITMGPGVEVRMSASRSLILDGWRATLDLQGTSTEPVVFTGHDAQVPGSWHRILTRGCADAAEDRDQVVFSYADIGWGGSDGTTGMVTTANDCRVSASNTTVHDSLSYGIDGDFTDAGNLVFSQNTRGPFPEGN